MATNNQIRIMETFQLTPSQKRIIEQLMKGYSNKEIADILHVTEKAIRCHLTYIYKKTKIESRTRLVVFFSERGWFNDTKFVNLNLPLGLSKN